MAAAAVEVAELGAPEAEAVGEKAFVEAEKLGSKLARKVGKKISTDAERAVENTAAPAGRDVVSRLVDVGTGVAIGQSLQGPRGQKAAEGVTQSLAAARQPAANGGGSVSGGALAAGGRARVAALIVLLLIVVAVSVAVAVERPGALASFWTGMVVGPSQARPSSGSSARGPAGGPRRPLLRAESSPWLRWSRSR